MKNTFGQNISVTIYGESHGTAIGVVLDGFASGIPVDEAFMQHQLTLRRPSGKISTARQEPDPFQILSGVYENKTTGTPICIMIPNTQTKSKDYSATRAFARPGHADYTAYCKYHGFEDFRGGGHFSGRITAGLVAGGAIAISALKAKNIFIGTHIKSCGGVKDRDFSEFNSDIQELNQKVFAVLDATQEKIMQEKISETAQKGDSIGGVLETAVINMPAGVGEPWFDTIEGVLAHALFSIPAIKGIQFGDAFDMVDNYGSQYNDSFRMQENHVITETNHNAGINGGITNGMPIVFRCAVKPTPSIYQTQKTINFFEKQNADLQIKGRHDPAIIHRARVVVDSITALVLCDILSGRYGTDWLAQVS
ncbi:MAG: chorismate synthase [Oscillospiraceae bacterium]|nr:chorismate synthase [Oscillospiraceae bacterium]MDE7093672.1 chorismate synthase [Oscillospiraceae bacterium]